MNEIHLVRIDIPESYVINIDITETIGFLLAELEAQLGVNTKQLVLLAYNGQVANPNARIAAFGCGADEDTPFFLFPLQFEEEHHDPLSLDDTNTHLPAYLQNFSGIHKIIDQFSKEIARHREARAVLSMQDYSNFINEQRNLGEFIKAKYNECFNILESIKRLAFHQRQGLETAWTSIQSSLPGMKQKIEKFLDEYTKQEARHQDLLNNFDLLLDILSTIKISPALSNCVVSVSSAPTSVSTPTSALTSPSAESNFSSSSGSGSGSGSGSHSSNAKLLIDFVDVDECNRVKQICEETQKKLGDKVRELQSTYNSVIAAYNSRHSFANDQEFHSLLTDIHRLRESTDKMLNYSNILKQDQTTMPITKENNAKHLAQMANLFKELANVTIKFESHLHESASNFPAKVVLKTIATISTELQGVQNLVHLYTNSMDTKSKDFSQLRQVYVIPLAYAQLLMELDFRQQHFQELYSVFRLAAREFLDGLCQFENTRREKFNETSTLLQSSVPGQHLLPSLPSTTNLMSSTATAAGATSATSATSTALMINSSKTKQLFIKPFYILGLDEKVELTSVLYSKISSSQLPLVTADDLKELRAVIEAYRSSNTNLVTFILNDLDRHAQWFASTVQYMTASCSVVRQNNLAFKKNTNLPLTSSGVKNMAENEIDVLTKCKARIADLEDQLRALEDSKNNNNNTNNNSNNNNSNNNNNNNEKNNNEKNDEAEKEAMKNFEAEKLKWEDEKQTLVLNHEKLLLQERAMVDSIQTELKTIQQAFSEKEAEMEQRHQSELKKLRETLESLQSECEAQKAGKVAAETELTRVGSLVSQLEAVVSSKTSELSALNALNEQLGQRQQELDTALTNLSREKEHRALEEQGATELLNQKLTQLEQQLLVKTNELSQLQEKTAQLESHCSTTTTLLSSATEENKLLEAKLETLASSSQSSTTDLSAKLEEAAKQKTELEQKLNSVTELQKTAEKQLEATTTNFNSTLSELNDLKLAYTNQQQENTELKGAAESLRAELAKAEGEKASLVESLKAELAKVESERAALAKQDSEQRQQIAVLNASVRKEADSKAKLATSFANTIIVINSALPSITYDLRRCFEKSEEPAPVIKTLSNDDIAAMTNLQSNEIKNVQNTIKAVKSEVARIYQLEEQKKNLFVSTVANSTQALIVSLGKLESQLQLPREARKFQPASTSTSSPSTPTTPIADSSSSTSSSTSSSMSVNNSINNMSSSADILATLKSLDISQISSHVTQVMNQLSSLTEQVLNLEIARNNLTEQLLNFEDARKKAESNKLTILNPQVNDLVAFFPTKTQKWVAFLLDKPDGAISRKYYLSDECASELNPQGDHLIARIISIEDKTTTKDGKSIYVVTATRFTA